jgi:hypothetical protein
MAHAEKPDFVFRRNGRVNLNRRGASVQSPIGSRGVRISGSNAGYIMFRGSVKSNGYRLHSPVSPSLPLPCVTLCHHISTGLYLRLTALLFQIQFLDTENKLFDKKLGYREMCILFAIHVHIVKGCSTLQFNPWQMKISPNYI